MHTREQLSRGMHLGEDSSELHNVREEELEKSAMGDDYESVCNVP